MSVQWQTPSDDGGVGISYTLTLTSDDDTTIEEGTVSLNYMLCLNYSTNYTVVILANNCVGYSHSTALAIIQG